MQPLGLHIRTYKWKLFCKTSINDLDKCMLFVINNQLYTSLGKVFNAYMQP